MNGCRIRTPNPSKIRLASITIQRGKGCVFSAENRHLEGQYAAGI